MARLITLDEAAELYGVSRRTIRRYVSEGRLRAYRLGPRLLRLDADEVNKQLFSRPIGGGAA